MGRGDRAVTRDRSNGQALAEAAQRYIEAHSTERFSLEKMSRALYINGSYLMRVFRQMTGTTPLCYHHKVRCDRAKALLTKTDQTISQVGETVGFVTSSHFTHVFRDTVGCTPTEYRRQHRQADEGEQA